MRLDSAGAEHGTSGREDSRQGVSIKPESPVLDEPEKPVPDADHVDAAAQHGFADPSNRRVQAGAVAACGQDADPLDTLHGLNTFRAVPCP
jgi:hypothetical protein